MYQVLLFKSRRYLCKGSIGQQQETCLTGPLEYKYHMIFVLVLGVICTLRSEVG